MISTAAVAIGRPTVVGGLNKKFSGVNLIPEERNIATAGSPAIGLQSAASVRVSHQSLNFFSKRPQTNGKLNLNQMLANLYKSK